MSRNQLSLGTRMLRGNKGGGSSLGGDKGEGKEAGGSNDASNVTFLT